MALKISIVTPSYNQASFIEATIKSIMSQDYPYVELIVIDGGSTDDTVSILQAQTDPRLTWISEPDKGQSDAINKGMKRVSGDILAYLNSDDLYLDGTLLFVAQYFETHPDVQWIYGDCTQIDAEGQTLDTPFKAEPYSLKRLLTARRMIPQPACFWRKQLAEAVGPFDATMHFTMDHDYWVRAVADGFQPVYVEKPLAAFRLHGESKSVSQNEKFTADRIRVLDKLYGSKSLSAKFLELKDAAYAYGYAAGIDHLWFSGEKKAARPHIRRLLSRSIPLRLRVLLISRYVESYIGIPISGFLTGVYRKFAGLD